eukprot:Blabericola_migrator_1__4826@NODE_2533_length_2638_cov_124_569428_g523_i1_p1_GENE_NODE_2533_length_2638_cov_124_569428_g523_i1NODE_2533_length_2638_cov_124_569428_g523_i1_p1_ORF_typecomplete_len531_score49_41_NODE_2533_length_2638_cov_124_569428_g523_i14452037
MNVLHKARAHLATLERFIDEFPASAGASSKRSQPLQSRLPDESLIGQGRQPLATVPSEVELVAPDARRSPPRSAQSSSAWSRRGSRHSFHVPRNPAFAVVASAWASITSGFENAFRSQEMAESSAVQEVEVRDYRLPSRDVQTGRINAVGHDPVNVLHNASRYSQTMRTPRHRLEWIRMIFGAWCFKCFRRSGSASNIQACSACLRELGFPSINIPCVCPVCYELYCPRCYGGSVLSRLFGDRGCRRCAIVVQRYERFHGWTARLLEAGIYCVVASGFSTKKPQDSLVVGVADDSALFQSDVRLDITTDHQSAVSLNTSVSDTEMTTVPSTAAGTGSMSDPAHMIRALEVFPDSEDVAAYRTVTCFTFQPRPLNPLGELGRTQAAKLDQLTHNPLENEELAAIPMINRLKARCAAWFYLNVDTAEFEFRSLARQGNLPVVQGQFRIELVHGIQAIEEIQTVILYKLANRRKVNELPVKVPWWAIQFPDRESWTQWAQMIKLAWELLAPERVERRARVMKNNSPSLITPKI